MGFAKQTEIIILSSRRAVVVAAAAVALAVPQVVLLAAEALLVVAEGEVEVGRLQQPTIFNLRLAMPMVVEEVGGIHQ